MTSSRTVLVVEDDTFTRELMGRVVKSAGHEVIFAIDGVSAVEIAAAQKPDLVITDGLLPRLHGFLVCKALKEMSSPPKVILVTAVYTKPFYKWEIITQYGADEVLNKPLTPSDLIRCLKKFLPGEETNNEELLEPTPEFSTELPADLVPDSFLA